MWHRGKGDGVGVSGVEGRVGYIPGGWMWHGGKGDG